MGYYVLKQDIEFAEDWVIILDESIQIGASKLLLILGIRDSLWNFDRPLQLNDLQVLYLSSYSPYDWSCVSDALEKITSKVGKIKYAIADQGGIIQKALKYHQIPAVLDITHVVANLLKKQYKEDPQYQGLNKQLGTINHQIKQTALAGLMAPKQRNKCRFMNLQSLSTWGNKILKLLLNTQQKNTLELSSQETALLHKMGKITHYQHFFNELDQVLRYVQELFTKVKTFGINAQVISNLETITLDENNHKVIAIQQEITQYLNKVNQLSENDDFQTNTLCCSDVIESTFGRFKNQMGQYYQNGVTSLALVIPAFTCPITETIILEAMNNTSQKDIIQWEEKYISTTLLKTRRKLIPKKIGKKKTKKEP